MSRTSRTLALVALPAALLLAPACSSKEQSPAATAALASKNPAAKGAAKAVKVIPTDKKPNPVPSGWAELVNQKKGFRFSVPEGAKDHSETKGDLDVYLAEVPKPYDISIYVVAYKNRRMEKDDLFSQSKALLEAFGAKEAALQNRKDLTGDYALSEVTYTADEKGARGKVLVATDVTDNYIVFVGCPKDVFQANERTIDAIWGSFAMFSGGSSGES